MTTVLLDGAMGTALIEAGLPSGDLPEAWLVRHPERIARVHAGHAAAGARILLTCTFNIAAPRLDEAAADAVEGLAARAVRVARVAAPTARIAGAVGPTLLPGGENRAELDERYARAYRALAAAGADLAWAESLQDLSEAQAALAAARRSGLAAVVTFTFRHDGLRLHAASGEPALECLEAMAREGAAAVGVNCVLPDTPIEQLLAQAAHRLALPLVAKPSAGLPGRLLAPARFATWAASLASSGARWIGGCCGAGADHLTATAAALRDRP